MASHRLATILCLTLSLIALPSGCGSSGAGGTDSAGCLTDSDCPEGQSCELMGEELTPPYECIDTQSDTPDDADAVADAGSTETDATAATGTCSDPAITNEVACEAAGETWTPACIPNCEGMVCGDDGCGGSCGLCTGTFDCIEGQCMPCQPACTGKECGADGCGSTCGTCEEGDLCMFGTCEPPPLANCLDLAPCIMAACKETDDLATCITEALVTCGPADSAAEEASATVLVNCMADNGCPFDGSGAAAGCQRGNCLVETVGCSQAVEGTLECHEMVSCIGSDTCLTDIMTGEPTNACIKDCLTTGSADAVTKYWDLMLCVDAQCLDSDVYDDMQLCFNEETDTGGACGWPLRDCLVSAL